MDFHLIGYIANMITKDYLSYLLGNKISLGDISMVSPISSYSAYYASHLTETIPHFVMENIRNSETMP